MINRIICAIFGHTKWCGMGWLGANLFNEMTHKYSCFRCGIIVYNLEPMWHLRYRNHKILDAEVDRIVNIIPVNKHTLGSNNYESRLNYINKKYPIKILAEIHDTTVEELKKIGYKR